MNNKLECLEKYNLPGEQPKLVVIWLHGLGASYNDFVPLIPELKLNQSIKFIFPNAPMRPITINNGYVMRGWYDIKDLSSRIDASIDFDGIASSAKAIEVIINQQIELGFKPSQIVLAGFSQGGVISYTTGLLYKEKLGGIIALSCYLPGVEDVIKNSSHNKAIPIFAAHGLHDPVVPHAIGVSACQSLSKAGFSNLKWYDYPMEHSVCNEEIVDLSKWFNSLQAYTAQPIS